MKRSKCSWIGRVKLKTSCAIGRKQVQAMFRKNNLENIYRKLEVSSKEIKQTYHPRERNGRWCEENQVLFALVESKDAPTVLQSGGKEARDPRWLIRCWHRLKKADLYSMYAQKNSELFLKVLALIYNCEINWYYTQALEVCKIRISLVP